MDDREFIEIFLRAFSAHTAGRVRTCDCGITYFDGFNSYDWEDGELEKLQAYPNAEELGYAPGDIRFEGHEYVDACTCWHERAFKIMRWMDGHAQSIAEYLTLRKERLQRLANDAPVVSDTTIRTPPPKPNPLGKRKFTI